MKEYQIPAMERLSLETENVITASGVVNNIVSSDDRAGANDIRVTEWNESWN